jgi:hypothetical protein
MSNAVLIIGESGTGKSTAIRTLPPEQTFIIDVVGKPLPFRGAAKKYTPLSPDGKAGNYYKTDDVEKITRIIRLVNDKRPEIKYLIIDDFGYTISNSYMRKALVTGYQKFSELGKNTWEVLEAVNNVRADLICFVTMHTDIDEGGKYKPKTIGKMIDSTVVIEGRFTHVLHALVEDGKYFFLTQNTGQHMAKTPFEMFNSMRIPNDLKLVADSISSYLDGDDTNV